METAAGLRRDLLSCVVFASGSLLLEVSGIILENLLKCPPTPALGITGLT